MPRPFGRDRLAGVRDGKLLLFCEASKGWRARTDATATSAEHPGTCVRWENELFEVEDFESGADGSVTYALRPWDERHAIRVVATYSPEAEAERSVEARDGPARRTAPPRQDTARMIFRSASCVARGVSVTEKRLRQPFAAAVAGGWLGIVGLLTYVFPASNRYTGRVWRFRRALTSSFSGTATPGACA